uniref:mRNA 5'-phosphatase n=1 Tax=viral metagenome TaxID=1070528 RepID=A0A6C0LG58_9ZZZZ
MSDSKSDFFDELKLGIDTLSSLICEYKKKDNIEIEIRLGQIQFNSFKSGLGSKDFFDKIKNSLDSAKCWDKVINNKHEELCHNGFRRTTVFNGKKLMKNQCIKKERLINKNFEYSGTPYDLRISVSREIPIEDKIKLGTGVLRKKNRFSYYYKDYIIDLTEVEQIDNCVSETNYELEIELINFKNNVTDKYKAHSALLLIRDVVNMCEKIEDGCKLVSSDKDTYDNDLSNKLNDMEINE